MKIGCLDCGQELVERYLEWSRRDLRNYLEGEGEKAEQEDEALDFPFTYPLVPRRAKLFKLK